MSDAYERMVADGAREALDVLSAAAEARRAGKPISDGQARTVAALYASGGMRGLAALATSGALLPEVDAEAYAESVVASVEGDLDGRDALTGVGGYAKSHGPRGPVAGWSQVWGE